MEESKEIVVNENWSVSLTEHDIKNQIQLIQRVMREVMQEGHHYGIIPGTDKATLLKPGAEKLTTLFRLAPVLTKIEKEDLGNGHRAYLMVTTLYHIPTGKIFGEGVGVCSTMESKFRWRNTERTCPECGKSAIIKGKPEYGGGIICFAKKGGCGAKFAENEPRIVNQPIGKVENTDIADIWNTVAKMCAKRSGIAAVLNATAASDIFTQDLDEEYTIHGGMSPSEPNEKPLRTVAKSEPEIVSPPVASSQAIEPPIGLELLWNKAIFKEGRRSTEQNKPHRIVLEINNQNKAFFCFSRVGVLREYEDWTQFNDLPCEFRAKKETKKDGTVFNNLLDLRFELKQEDDISF